MAPTDRLPLPDYWLVPDDVWWIEPEAGIRLRAGLWRAEDPLGHVIFLTGRTEYLEKVALPAEQFVARGYSVITLDWRGQGLSSRQAEPGLKGHVDDYIEFQTDLDALLTTDQARALTGARVLVAHSMGGGIATHAMARPSIAKTLDAAILSAPMLGISMSPVARIAAWVTMKIGIALGYSKSWPPLGDVSTPYVLTEPEDSVLTSDERVLDWMIEIARTRPESSIASPTLGWYRAATAAMKKASGLPPPGMPVLCLLGENERVVDQASVVAGAARMNAKLVRIDAAQHEVLIENASIREAVWRAIDAFFEANQLPRRQPASGGS